MDLWSMTMHSGLPDQHHCNALHSPYPPQQNGQAHSSPGGPEATKGQNKVPLKEQAPFIDQGLPAAVHAQHDGVTQGSQRGGKFTYYFTVGLDAEAAYRSAV